MSVKRIKTCNEIKPKVKPFPKLMINNPAGNIWLMTSDHSGTCLVKSTYGEIDVGRVHETLNKLRTFVDYNEPLTLQNE